MNRYQPNTPRAMLGIAAIAMAVLTLGLAVVVPAKLAPAGQDGATLLTAKSKAPTAIEVLIVPARIEVIGVRESTVAGGAPEATPAKGKQQG